MTTASDNLATVTSLKDALDISLNSAPCGYIDANFTIDVDGEVWSVYEISIAHRDILCFCDYGTATFLVDSYGDRHVAELFDWERD